MSNKRNRWISGDFGFASWWAVLPAPSKNPDALVRFGSRFVDAGRRHRVWDAHRYSAGTGHGDTFEQHARDAIGRGWLPMLIRRGDDPEPSGTVAIYRNDEIVEVVTSDLGRLLRDLCPNLYRRAFWSSPPVKVRGGSFDMDETKEISVSIELDSDIWFPRVIGLCQSSDDADEDDERPDWYDNAALASRHTPRFNAFLQEVHAATIEAHGEWHHDRHLSSVAERYLEMCNPDGIVL